MFAFLVTSSFTFLSLFIPGRIAVHIFPISQEEKLGLSFGVSMLLYYIISLVLFFSSPPLVVQQMVILGIFSLAVVSYWRYIPHKNKGQELSLVATFFLAYIALLSIQALLPIYVGAGWQFDWWEHYQRGLFFFFHLPTNTHFGPYELMARPPLFNLIVAYFFPLLGSDFWVYQCISTLLNSVIMFPCFLICRKFLPTKPAVPLFALISCCLILNPAVQTHLLFTWTKALSAYFTLLGFYFFPYRQVKGISQWVLSGVTLGAGFLTHFATGPYMIALTFYAGSLTLKKTYRWYHLIIFLLAFCLPAIPWLMWTIPTYGLEKLFTTNSTYEGQKHLSGEQILIKDIFNSTYTIVPGMPLLATNFFDSETNRWIRWYDSLFLLYATTFWGTLTLTVSISFAYFICFYRQFFKKLVTNLRSKSQLSTLTAVFVFLITATNSIPGFAGGFAHVTLLPVTLMSLCLFLILLFRTKHPVSTSLQKTISLLYLVESVFFLGLKLIATYYHIYLPLSGQTNDILLSAHQNNYLLKQDQHLLFLFDYLKAPLTSLCLLFFSIIWLGWLAHKSYD